MASPLSADSANLGIPGQRLCYEMAKQVLCPRRWQSRWACVLTKSVLQLLSCVSVSSPSYSYHAVFFIPSSHVEDDSNRYLGFLLDKLALSIYTDAILPFLSCLSLFQTQFAFSRFSDLGNAVDCIKQVNFSTQFLVHRHFKYRVVKVKLMIILIKTPRQLSKIFLYTWIMHFGEDNIREKLESQNT